ncbi:MULTISPECIES: MCE family protein [unclassified Nocardioides]|uniref:MCE family protein n=1 Tax=unclassified Nocardioides TaxID=2615069 RepID=UPI0036155D05
MRVVRRHPVAVAGIIAFALVAGLMTSIVAQTLAKRSSTPTTRVGAVFTDATGLKAGDDVRVAGVRVGRVAAVGLDGDLARVSLDVADGQALTDHTIARIEYLNLMGQRYVALERGRPGGAALERGATIPVDRTRPALDLTALFNAFRPLFRAIRPGDVNELAGNIVQVLQGQGPTVRDLLRQTGRLLGTVADRDEIIGAVIDNVTAVMQTADAHRKELKGLVTDLGDLTNGLARDRRTIAAGIDHLQELTTITSDVVGDTAPDLTRDIEHLRRLTDFLSGRADEIAEGIGGIPVQLAIYARTLGYGSFLNVYVCQLRMGAPGTPAIELPLPDKHTERCR